MGRFVRAFSLVGILCGMVAIAAPCALATGPITLTMPSGYEAVISNATLGGCNANSYGYEIGSEALVQVGAKPVDCSIPTPQPDRSTGPVTTTAMFRLYLADSTCSATYYSDTTGTADHALVGDNGNGTYSVAINDGGAFCDVATTTAIPASTTNANLTATVTILPAPPTVTVTAPAPPSGQSGYFNRTNLAAYHGSIPINVSASELTGTGMKSISCTDNDAPIPILNVVGGGTETMTGIVMVSGDGNHAIACLAASSVSATGNTGGSNTATVNVDTTAPSLSVPASPLVVQATSLSGAYLSSYGVSVSDPDGTPSLSCTPAAPATFAIGDTTVSCQAADRAGNVSIAQFVVRVQQPPATASFASITSDGAAATVTIACSGGPGQVCAGTLAAHALELVRGRHVIAARAAATTTTRSVLVASLPFLVKAGASVPVSIVLNAAGRTLLAKLYSLPATLSLPNGVTQRMTFAYPLVTTLPDSSWDTWTWLNTPCSVCYTMVDTSYFFGIPGSARLLPTARVDVRCSGTGCPPARSFRPGRRSLRLDSMFSGRRLGPGVVIRFVITAPNSIGRVITWRTVVGSRPIQSVKCLVPGHRMPLGCRGGG